MRLGILLALVAASFAHQCSVGNLVLENGIIITRSIENRECDGLCKREVINIDALEKTIVLLSCEDNKVARIINAGNECRVGDYEDCHCETERCNDVTGVREELVQQHIEDFPDNIKCYVGIYASDQYNIGDLVQCSTGSVCMKVNGTSAGYSVEIYSCMPQLLCTTLFPNIQSGTSCTQLSLNGTSTSVMGCCCVDQDCSSLVTPGTVPTPFPTANWGGPTIQCYSGITLNGQVQTGGSFGDCQGDCASARIRTTYNGGTLWGEVFSCDPASLFNQVGINNQCQSLNAANISGVPTVVVSGCMCSSDKCIDPTVVPPVYPIRHLKCFTGLSNGTSYVGAEMPCDGRCGYIKFTSNGVPMTYYMCAPYAICAGFGMAATEGLTYNPPQDEEIEAYCCSASDNCNVANNPNITVNTTYMPTATYPTICYGGIWVNGVPITNAAYGLCQGECASANFLTTFAGQSHNTTIYTCDPVTMCSMYGIKNGCGQIGNGVTGCCCDYDGCLDPNRGGNNFTPIRCYTGITVAEDNIYEGGEISCMGMCSSISTIVNSKNVTTYWCAPWGTCRWLGLGLGGNDDCSQIPGADPPVIGCCCGTDNCNSPPGHNYTTIPLSNEAPIVCYQGLHVNGNNYSTFGYQVCDGDCVSIMLSGTVNATTNYATLYACDPSSACAAMGIRNNCSTIDGTVSVCCCDSDACIDPIVGRVPGIPLECYVGLTVRGSNISVGAAMTCDGMCASVATIINNAPAISFHCVPKSLCKSLGLNNQRGRLYLDRAIDGYCCDNAPFCNVVNTTINTTGLQPAPQERPKACYSGIFINGSAASDGGWVVCQGDCIAVNMNTTYDGVMMTASIYSCDPTIVCSNLGTMNNCHMVEPGLQACCCNTDACIDPTVSPPKLPTRFGDICYVGVWSNDTGISIGSDAFCDQGACASITSSISGAVVNVYACVPNYVCDYLSLYDSCSTLVYDRAFTACCCTSGPNCNIAGLPIPTPDPPGRIRDFPITCPQGLYIDDRPVTPELFTVCDGDCARMTINTTSPTDGQVHNASLFTCDPSRVCRMLNISNQCAQPVGEPGLTACCCDTDGCLDPMRFKFEPTNPLRCYVGVHSNAVKAGAEVYCNGKCASIQGNVANDVVTVFACMTNEVCRAQELYDDCKPIYDDRNVTACCCDDSHNCNVFQRSLQNDTQWQQNVSSIREYPIVCYNGIFINGAEYIGGGGWQSCEGDCTAINLYTTYNNQPMNASIYTCDPVRVCRQLGLNNNCSTIEPGLEGCCCNTDACIDPTKNPPRTPWAPLQCYVGVQSKAANINVGAVVQCDGKCAKLYGSIAGVDTVTYHCVPSQICTSLELFDTCRSMYFDRSVTACCCDNYNNCNVNDTAITIPTPQPLVEFPVACYSGVVVNGTAVTPITLSVCQGQCASVTLLGAVNGTNINATLYTCDPSSVCQTLNITNTCASPEPGLYGCCCDSDTCINPYTGRSPGNPLTCYVGIWAAYNNYSVGGEVMCTGMCGSLSTLYNGSVVKSYHCVPQSVCKTMEINNNCSIMTTDRAITACCCDGFNNCNVLANETINTSNVVPTNPSPPITCYSAIYVNGTAVVNPTVVACYGQCASVTYSTTYNGQGNVLTLYTCDPTAVCDGLGLKDSCAVIDNTGLSGCCCSTNMCLTPNVRPTATNPTTSAVTATQAPGQSTTTKMTNKLSIIASLILPFFIGLYLLVIG